MAYLVLDGPDGGGKSTQSRALVEFLRQRGRTVHHLRAYKISKRFDCDISALCGGFALTLGGERVADVRLAFGGMAAVVRRAAGAEAALRGARWDEATLQRAQQALDADFTPLSDLRASADYRRQAARGLLRRLWLETRPGDALPPAATSVWARGAADTAKEAQP